MSHIVVIQGPRRSTGKPRYQHDCQNCRFMGSISKYDIWVCDHPTIGPSIIARYGNDGPQYASMCDHNRTTISKIKSEISGLTEAQVIVLAAYRMMPSLLLNDFHPAL